MAERGPPAMSTARPARSSPSAACTAAALLRSRYGGKLVAKYRRAGRTARRAVRRRAAPCARPRRPSRSRLHRRRQPTASRCPLVCRARCRGRVEATGSGAGTPRMRSRRSLSASRCDRNLIIDSKLGFSIARRRRPVGQPAASVRSVGGKCRRRSRRRPGALVPAGPGTGPAGTTRPSSSAPPSRSSAPRTGRDRDGMSPASVVDRSSPRQSSR
jgi:hypothetical protein